MKKTEILISILILLFFSCRSNAKENGEGQNLLFDTLGLPLGRKSTERVKSTDPGAEAKSFQERSIQFAEKVFDKEYQGIEPSLGDDLPFFSGTQSDVLLKFRKIIPIQSGKHKGLYPRFVFHGWEFSSHEKLIDALLNWLNKMNHTGDSIRVGLNVEKIKSQPMLGISNNTHFYLIKASCLDIQLDWPILKTRFFDGNREEGISFEIKCEGGKLVWNLDE